jgi:hypothetical protein
MEPKTGDASLRMAEDVRIRTLLFVSHGMDREWSVLHIVVNILVASDKYHIAFRVYVVGAGYSFGHDGMNC